MRKSKKLIGMFIVLIFALTQILPSGYIWAGDSHIDKAMGRVNQDMMASFAPRYVQQAGLEKNQSLTTDDINRKKALEEPLENLKKPINKPKTESVTLRKPQEASSVSNEAKTETVTYSITVGGDTGGGTGGGTTTPPKGEDDISGNNVSQGAMGIRLTDGTIVMPGSPRKETGTDNQGRDYIKEYDAYGRVISDYRKDRGRIAYIYDDTMNKVDIKADFSPEKTLPSDVVEAPFTSIDGTWKVVDDGMGNYVYTQETWDGNWLKTVMNDVEAKAGSSIEYRFQVVSSDLSNTNYGGLFFGLKNDIGYLATIGWGGWPDASVSLWSVNLQNDDYALIEIVLSENYWIEESLNWHTIKVDLSTDTAAIYLDGISRIQASGLDLSGGGIGFSVETYGGGDTPTVYFDDITVTNPSDYTLVTIPLQQIKATQLPKPIPITPTVPPVEDTTAASTATPQEAPIAGQKGIHDRPRFIVPEEYNQAFRRNKRSLELKMSDEAFNYDRRKYHDYEKELKETLSQWTPLRALTKTMKIEESLQSFIRMLVNKPNKTKAEDQMIEVIGMVMAESAYIPGDVMEEFEQVIQRVRVAQKMEGVLNEGDLKRMTDAMTDLSQRQKELYKDYLSRTENTYEQLAKLLGIDIDIEEVPDEYITIANMSIQAKRKILVDLKLLDLELAGDKGGLTDSQRKALKINESSLRKVREEYANKMAAAITKFINTIKDALRNISGSGAVINESDINTNSLKTLFLLDKGIV